MIGYTETEYLTDKDDEKIREYIGVIEDRNYNLETELFYFKVALAVHLNPTKKSRNKHLL